MQSVTRCDTLIQKGSFTRKTKTCTLQYDKWNYDDYMRSKHLWHILDDTLFSRHVPMMDCSWNHNVDGLDLLQIGNELLPSVSNWIKSLISFYNKSRLFLIPISSNVMIIGRLHHSNDARHTVGVCITWWTEELPERIIIWQRRNGRPMGGSYCSKFNKWIGNLWVFCCVTSSKEGIH